MLSVEILRKEGISRRVLAVTLLALMMLASLPAVRPAFASAVVDGGFEDITCVHPSFGAPAQCGAWTATPGNNYNEFFGIASTEHHSGAVSFYFTNLDPAYINLSQGIGIVASGEKLDFWIKGSVPASLGFGYRISDTSAAQPTVQVGLGGKTYSDWTLIEAD